MEERWISNSVLNAVIRPQEYNMCSIQSLRTVFKLLLGKDFTVDEILEKSGLTRKYVENGKVGNNHMIAIAGLYGVNLSVYKKGANVPYWNDVKRAISADIPLIFHRPGHYCIITGYISEPVMTKNPKTGVVTVVGTPGVLSKRWLVIADHRVRKKTDLQLGMIELISWEEFIAELDKHTHSALLVPELMPTSV